MLSHRDMVLIRRDLVHRISNQAVEGNSMDEAKIMIEIIQEYSLISTSAVSYSEKGDKSLLPFRDCH